MRVLLRQQQIGEVAGGVAAGAAVTAAGAPELVPLVAPAGAMAGREAEKAIRGVVKGDPAEPSPSLCRLNIWRAANLLDSLTDTLYRGKAPDSNQFDVAFGVLENVQRNCGISLKGVIDDLIFSKNDVLTSGNLIHARTEAGSARAKMQQALEHEAGVFL